MIATAPRPHKDRADFKPVRDARMERLAERRDRLGREGRRSNFVDNPEFLVYHWCRAMS